jgi:NADH-quinone oxidoreductase subunit C
MDATSLITTVGAFDSRIQPREKTNRPAVQVPAEILPALARWLRDEPGLRFTMLSDHSAIDWQAENRIELVYQLYSLEHRHTLTVFASVPREHPEAPSVSGVWRIAEWQEREVYDMFGVLYSGHPDLRRILLEDDWKGFPLRKDYKDECMLERSV